MSRSQGLGAPDLPKGFDQAQIANDVSASQQTIAHYMRFRDQMEIAAAGRERLRLVSDQD